MAKQVNYQIEHDVQNEIRIWCGEHNLRSFRANVVGGYTPDGRWITSGLPEGFPDLLVLDNHGQTIYVECKTLKGRARKKQIEFREMMEATNHIYLMPRSLDQFIEMITPYIDKEN